MELQLTCIHMKNQKVAVVCIAILDKKVQNQKNFFKNILEWSKVVLSSVGRDHIFHILIM